MQRRILHRLLGRLRVHPCVTGFEKGHSIVTNAVCHQGKAVVIRMDIRDFFANTSAKRVRKYFQTIGWNREATEILVRLCTYENGLPQGAPTSPRLANLVNYGLDAHLEGLAKRFGGAYTRYADDLTFSFDQDGPTQHHPVISVSKLILASEGYSLHMKRKLHIRRQHERQLVTGLVVNVRPALPRETRRWLRAVEHRASTGGNPTLSEGQREGWHALQSMIETQRAHS